jgi:hypothetical protein
VKLTVCDALWLPPLLVVGVAAAVSPFVRFSCATARLSLATWSCLDACVLSCVASFCPALTTSPTATSIPVTLPTLAKFALPV